MPYIFGKLWHLAIIWAIRKAFQFILQGVRILLANHTRISPTSDNDSCTGFLRASSFHLIPSSKSWPPIPLPLSLGTTHILPWLVMIKIYIRHFFKFSILKVQNCWSASSKWWISITIVYQVQNFPFCRLQPSRQGWPPPFDLELSNLFLLRTNYLISLFSKENLTPWLQNVFLEYDCN